MKLNRSVEVVLVLLYCLAVAAFWILEQEIALSTLIEHTSIESASDNP